MTNCSVNEDLSGTLAETAFPFAGLLEKEDLVYLGRLMERHPAKAGECLWREGEMDDRLVLVVGGRVKLVKEAENPRNPLIIGLFGSGSLVVDLAFPEGLARESSAYAVEDSEIFYLARPQFETVLAERPALARHILGEALISFAEQLRSAYRRLAVFF